MRIASLLTAAGLALAGAPLADAAVATGPLRVSPDNPRYFADASGRAVFLTGMHTWGNLQDRGETSPPPVFDYTGYLDRMNALHHNAMRMWAWENPRWAPWTAGDYFVDPMPFARTGPGNAVDGRPRFDCTRFDQGYFDRLRARVIAARDRGIYVSVMLFQGWSIDGKSQGGNPWPSHPFNRANNVNGIDGDPNGDNTGAECYSLSVPAVNAAQKAYVRKVVDTVNDLDNVLYEITNEGGGYSAAWQYDMIRYVKSLESGRKVHPVGMTYPWPAGDNSVLWNSPADWIAPGNADGYSDNPPAGNGAKVVVADTDHIWGMGGDEVWAWKSFARGLNTFFMDDLADLGAGDYRTRSRRAMGQTEDWAQRIDLRAMPPRGDLTSTGYCLAKPGAEYLVLQPYAGGFSVDLGGTAGSFAVEWFEPASGATTSAGTVAGGGPRSFTPPFGGMAVLHLTAQAGPAPVIGNGTGLSGAYYAAMGPTGAPALTRVDGTVDFDWGGGSPGAGVPSDRFSARWTGRVQAQYSERYVFTTTSDDGVRLRVNGVLLIDNWTDHAPTANSGAIDLVAGQPVDVVMEYYENGGGAVAKLAWASPSTAQTIVPRTQLYPAAGATPYGGAPRAIPGVIQAEDFDDGGEGVAYHDSDAGNNGGGYRATDVDVRACVDAGREASPPGDGGWQVGWCPGGEWLQYTVNVATAGTYDVAVRVASGASGATLRLTVDGADVSGPFSFGGTGGWDTWTDAVKRGIALPAGTHALRLLVDAGGLDINRLTFTSATTTPPPTASFGVDLAGPQAVVDGETLQGYEQAVAGGLSVTNAQTWTGTYAATLSPAADADTRTMLQSAMYRGSPPNGQGFALAKALPNGVYDVSVWSIENYQANYRDMDLRLEGTTVATAIGDLPLWSWRKYGPYRVTVSDGVLNVDVLRRSKGDPMLTGLLVVPAPPTGVSDLERETPADAALATR